MLHCRNSAMDFKLLDFCVDLVDEVPREGQFVMIYISENEVIGQTIRNAKVGYELMTDQGTWVVCTLEIPECVIGYFTTIPQQ